MPVYDDEKTEEQRLRDITGIDPAEEKAMEARAADSNGFYNGDDDSKASSAKDLGDAEEKPADTVGRGYSDNETMPRRTQVARFLPD
jgi:hypothetical protein